MDRQTAPQKESLDRPTPIIHRKAKANGLDLHFLVAGEGEPILLLHGFPQHSLMWRRVMPTLATRHTVIAPDLRGTGGTTITQSGYDKHTLAADVHSLLEQLDLHLIDVVGYDHGAGVAYQLAAHYPGLVRRLCVIEYTLPGFGYEEDMRPKPDWNAGSPWQLAFFTVPEIAEHFMRGRERDLLTWFFWHASCDPSSVSSEDFEEYVRQVSKPGALRAGINYYAAVWKDMVDHKDAARAKLKVPVLALGGEFSYGNQIFEAWRSLADDVAGGIIKSCGHWPADENPDEVARLLLEFVEGTTTARQGDQTSGKTHRSGSASH